MKNLLFFLAIIPFVFSCQEIDKEDFDVGKMAQGPNFDVNYLQLRDDSTGMAGTLYMTAKNPELKLTWNVPASCNIDTTATTVIARNGRCQFPIKWNKQSQNGTYAPDSMAFDAGVLVTDGEISRYVRLLWSSTIDTMQVEDKPIIITRAGEALPKAVTVSVEPPSVDMDIVGGGYCQVTFTGTNILTVDQQHILAKNKINKDGIPRFLRTGGDDIILFDWVDEAPKWNFDDYITFKAGGLDLYVLRVRYNIPVEDNLVWDFVRTDIPAGSYLPSTKARVEVIAKTNTSWSVESPLQEGTSIDHGGTTLSEKTLPILIQDNPTSDIREVVITAKSNDVVNKDTVLTYYQLGNAQAGIFDFLGSDPVVGSHLTAEQDTVKITVRADIPWYVSCGCTTPGREDYTPDGLQTYTEEFIIPANTTGMSQIINLKISDRYNKYTQTIQFIQDATGGGNPGTGDGSISSVIISPQGEISEYGAELKASFMGNFAGDIDVRATSSGQVITAASGKVNTSMTLTIPQLIGPNRTIEFEYSIDGGKNWLEIERRMQINETFSPGLIQPRSLTLPASGQALSWSFNGTYSRKVTWRAVSNDIAIAEITANGPTLSLVIPANTTGQSRKVDFMYKLEGGAWINMEYRTQFAQ